MTPPFLPGIDVLLSRRRDLLRGRLALVTHPAALTARGQWSADALREHPEADLQVLMGPEHGVFGHAGAGEPVASGRHPAWDIPAYSLYGDRRKPTAEMLEDVDTVIFDLQDLGVRCYTYVSTLDLVLSAAAASGRRVVVTDRPVPLPRTVDGPGLDPGFASFVAQIPVPLVYGMTPGETARFLAGSHPGLDLEVVPMTGYHRDPARPHGAPPWVPPSPGIRSWETGLCYPITVCFEALPAVNYGQGTALAFQLAGAPGLDAPRVCARLRAAKLPGLQVYPHWFFPAAPAAGGAPWPAVRFVITDATAVQPIRAAMHLLAALQDPRAGVPDLWSAEGTRPEFFDKLFGTDAARRAVQAGEDPDRIAADWEPAHRSFHARRAEALLYAPREERPQA